MGSTSSRWLDENLRMIIYCRDSRLLIYGMSTYISERGIEDEEVLVRWSKQFALFTTDDPASDASVRGDPLEVGALHKIPHGLQTDVAGSEPPCGLRVGRNYAVRRLTVIFRCTSLAHLTKVIKAAELARSVLRAQQIAVSSLIPNQHILPG
jgi:hypothetical protein